MAESDSLLERQQVASDTYTGAISEPCSSTAPRLNHKAFASVNWFSSASGSSIQGYGFCHSSWHNRPTMYSNSDVPRYASPRHNHTWAKKTNVNTVWKCVSWRNAPFDMLRTNVRLFAIPGCLNKSNDYYEILQQHFHRHKEEERVLQ